MRRQIRIILATLLCLILLDGLVAVTLATVAPKSLERFFDYGRSVPGKLADWRAHPGQGANLQTAGWLPEEVAESAAAFAAEPDGIGPVMRVYGMSFVNHITEAAAKIAPEIPLDQLSGPGAPPNFTYAAFLDDRANRRPGDVVVLGILSSSLAPMASFSNSSWAFEQPAPFTYPIFRPDAAQGLTRLDPLMQSLEQYMSGNIDAAAWDAQRQAEDALYSPVATALPVLDASPFARLVRRSLALDDIRRRERAVLRDPDDAPYPYGVVLRRMVTEFATMARADGQVPVVVLVQGQDGGDPDLAALVRPTLEAGGIPYFATVDHQDPRDPNAFVPDGHYRKAVDEAFGAALRALPAMQQVFGG